MSRGIGAVRATLDIADRSTRSLGRRPVIRGGGIVEA